MSRSDWDEIRENVIESFQDGTKDAKDYVEVTTALLWFERQRNASLCAALEEILKVARAALDSEREASSRPANLLQMVIDPCTGLPSRHQVLCTLLWDGQSYPLEEAAIEATVKDRTSDPGQYASHDTAKL
jgi:hypothetical protein